MMDSKETYYVQVFLSFLKEDFFDLFFSRLNTVIVHANNRMCFLCLTSNIVDFEGEKRIKMLLDLGQKKENSVSLLTLNWCLMSPRS